MRRRKSTGSFRASSLRVENGVERERRSSSTDVLADDIRKVCCLCQGYIDAGKIVISEDRSWHTECFVCAKCGTTLSHFHNHQDKLYCKQCIANVASVCFMCQEYVGSSYVIFKDNRYHAGCLRCSQCSLPLGSKEQYTITLHQIDLSNGDASDSQIVCDNCHHGNVLSLITNERKVSVKWGELVTQFIRKEMRVVAAPRSTFLREGDQITAVDGVAPSNLCEIDGSKVVTLTVTTSSSSRADPYDSPPITPSSPPPPSTRPHKRRLLKSLSSSPPPQYEQVNYVFSPSQVEVGEVIGLGFFGRVCEARFVETGERVCLKELKNVNIESTKFFVDEIALLKNLNHINVLTFKGIVSNPPNFSLLTEYVGGGTLRRLIKSQEMEISVARKVEIALDVSTGMSYLHSKDIIHRDLTSKNCLLRSDGSVVVADFGLAQYQNVTMATTSYLHPPIHPGKRRNDSVGGFFWRAPEMILNKPYDSKVDIFSYGIVMCELIARIKADPDILPRRITDWGVDETVYRNMVPPDFPPHLLNVVLQCCAPAPEHRPEFNKIFEFLIKVKDSETADDYRDELFIITRTLHSICEDE